jgi:hypothetical protein
LGIRVDSSEMAFFRTIGAATLAAALWAAGGTGFAFADPPPWAHGHGHKADEQQGSPRSHATVTGTIAGIDYLNASILVATPRGMVPVAVTPTTSIFRGSTFASFSDLGRGAHVSVDVSQIDGRLIAQIIRIR